MTAVVANLETWLPTVVINMGPIYPSPLLIPATPLPHVVLKFLQAICKVFERFSHARLFLKYATMVSATAATSYVVTLVQQKNSLVQASLCPLKLHLLCKR